MKTSALILLLFSACQPETIFVTARDVPDNPTFTVVSDDSEYATLIERELIQLGLKVVVDTSPIPKTVETTKQFGKSESTKDSRLESSTSTVTTQTSNVTATNVSATDDSTKRRRISSASRVESPVTVSADQSLDVANITVRESYLTYTGRSVDFILFANGNQQRVKIVRPSTMEIVAIFETNYSQTKRHQHDKTEPVPTPLAAALKALNVKIRAPQ